MGDLYQRSQYSSVVSGYNSPSGHVVSGGKAAYNDDVTVMASFDLLLQQGFSRGLAKELAANADSFCQRIWVVDNSGSMQIGDGHRVTSINGKIGMQPVSRWDELNDTVIYHSQMAAVMNSYTRFRLLNKPGPTVGRQEFSVGSIGADVDMEIRTVRLSMNRTKPDGVTPLTSHIWQIRKEIMGMLPQLRRTGRRVAVILATDGMPTNDQGDGGPTVTQEFVQALRALEGLPIWLVIRLCTDEDEITEFYNKLDALLGLNLEVLDDFYGESKEVEKYNPWLNYALPIHRCRELGYHHRLFDFIDERALTKEELREFCLLLFGTLGPDPMTSWPEFHNYIEECLSQEVEQWNPVKKKNKPWINLKMLDKKYGGKLFGRFKKK